VGEEGKRLKLDAKAVKARLTEIHERFHARLATAGHGKETLAEMRRTCTAWIEDEWGVLAAHIKEDLKLLEAEVNKEEGEAESIADGEY
jgi:hypothetical protein